MGESFNKGFESTFSKSLQSGSEAVSRTAEMRLKAKLEEDKEIRTSEREREAKTKSETALSKAVKGLITEEEYIAEGGDLEKLYTTQDKWRGNLKGLVTDTQEIGQKLKENNSLVQGSGFKQEIPNSIQAMLRDAGINREESDRPTQFNPKKPLTFQERLAQVENSDLGRGLDKKERIDVALGQQTADHVQQQIEISIKSLNEEIKDAERKIQNELNPTNEEVEFMKKEGRKVGGTGRKSFIKSMLDEVGGMMSGEEPGTGDIGAGTVTTPDAKEFARIKKLFGSSAKGIETVIDDIKQDNRITERELRGFQLLTETKKRKEALKRLGITEEDIDKSDISKELKFL